MLGIVWATAASVLSVPPTTLKKSISPLPARTRAISSHSSGSRPPWTCSSPVSRMPTTKPGPTASRMAPNTSSANRQRFSTLPP
jgi:hypothetical protein